MASIVKRNKSYSVVYRVTAANGEQKQKWETFRSKDDAVRRKEAIEASGSYVGVIPKVSTIKDLLDEYVKLYGQTAWGLTTYESRRALINKYIIPHIGSVALSSIDKYFLDRYFYKLRKDKQIAKSTTIISIAKILRSVFNQAVKWEFYSDNPMNHVLLPEVIHKRREYLNPEQVGTAITYAKKDNPIMSLAIQFAFSCSLRKGELLALKWKDIDFDNNILHINKELSRVHRDSLKLFGHKDVYHVFPAQRAKCKTRLVLKKPKTKAAIRTVYMPSSLANSLIVWKHQQRKYKKEFGQEYTDHGLVLAQENGSPFPEKQINIGFKHILGSCKLPNVVFHSLRHTSTSYKLVVSGGDIKSVQKDNGHSDADMVLKTYGHEFESNRKIIADRMEELFYSSLVFHD